ncbi:hypothetical protein ACFYZB_13320 [Streptomyces sp. NPDC001852]|uniref:hypothetical protein n=1 Tax=Streptomyces sp. NPDC001852 TaxID=3364619 RepID=UPI00369C8106
MTWTYCEQWNNLYTAVASPDDHSAATLRVKMRLETGYTSVIFMDAHGRDTLDHTFTLINGSLFLETATSYDYGDSQERGGYAEAERTESYGFTTDGHGIDVTSNWESVPNFGAYDALIRRDRAGCPVVRCDEFHSARTVGQVPLDQESNEWEADRQEDSYRGYQHSSRHRPLGPDLSGQHDDDDKVGQHKKHAGKEYAEQCEWQEYTSRRDHHGHFPGCVLRSFYAQAGH